MPSTTVLVLGAIAALLVLGGIAWAWALHRSAQAEAARQLCAALDRYLEALAAQHAAAFDAERLWQLLEDARGIKREHFPQLHPQMREIARLHGELMQLLLKQHLERHGVPVGWQMDDSAARAPQLRQDTLQAVAALKAQCRRLAGLEPDAPA